MFCDCGRHFGSNRASLAPQHVVRLAHDLEQKLLQGDEPLDLPILLGLSFEQVARLVRLIGSYGQPSPGRRPQKIRALGDLTVSWQVTSIAAEVLGLWPMGFQQLLRNLLNREVAQGNSRLPARFGYFYSALFKRFAEPEFDFLRIAFEDFIATHWESSLAKRNSRLSEALLQRAPWVPAKHARQYLSISPARLDQLVQADTLLVKETYSATGRRFLMVNRQSMESLRPIVRDDLDLASASDLLGLKQSRLRGVVTELLPAAQRIGGGLRLWSIPRSEVQKILEVVSGCKPCRSVLEGEVSLDHTLRFLSCTDTEVAKLLVAIRDHMLMPVAKTPTGRGLGQLILNKSAVRELLGSSRKEVSELLTIPEMATALCVKQEVAYFLVRNGLVESELHDVGRRSMAMVQREALEAFKGSYVFARDLAKHSRTSSRSLQAQIAAMGFHPIASPEIGGCRQVLYRLSESLLDTLGVSSWPPQIRPS
jgi:hypothetical protein